MSTAGLAEPAVAPIRMPAAAWSATALIALIVTGLTAWRLQGDTAVFACCYFAAVGVVLTAIDIAVMRLPDFLTLPSYPVMLVALAWVALGVGDGRPLQRAIEAAIAMLGLFMLLHLSVGAGLGDVKLAGLIGLLLGYFGWIVLFHGLFAASLLSMLWAAARRARGGRGGTIPLGPALVAGTLTVLLI